MTEISIKSALLGMRRRLASVTSAIGGRGLPRIAVFIDAENVSNRGIQAVFSHLTQNWNPTYRRAYGCGIANRKEILRSLGIVPVEVVPVTSGKNAADIALIIDAMLELNSGRTDAFCIVSGDADFTRLAWTIREKGLPVLVYGNRNAPVFLRRSCTEFHELKEAPRPARTGGADRSAENHHPLKDRREIYDLARKLSEADGRTTLRRINHEAVRGNSAFSPKQYGAPNLRTLLMTCKSFDVTPLTNSAGIVEDYELRLKPEDDGL
jgi:hypothetical protein